MGVEIGQTMQNEKAKVYYPKEDKIEDIELPVKGKWNIMTFYPGDFTFVCATDVEELQKKYDDFKAKDAEVFAISADSIFSHREWSKTSPRVSKSEIPLVEDFKKSIITDYGFLNSETGAARRGLAIVDPDGVLQYYAVFNDNLGKDVEHIYNSFEGLKYLHDTPNKEGHMCALPADWKSGKEPLDIDLVKDIGKL